MPFRSRLTRWGAISALALAIAGLLAGCATNSPSTLDPAGPNAEKEAGLFWLILVIATIVFVAVTGALIYMMIRYRARPGAPAARQIGGNQRLEIMLAAVPTIVLFVVLFATIFTMNALSQPKTSNVLTVRAIGHQWWWEFQYPDQKIVTADELYIPVNTVVHVELYSDNVIHSFWVPQLSGKTDVVPGHDNTTWIEASKIGDYRGLCTEFCGTQHAHMDYLVRAVPANQFQTWVTQQQAKAAAPTTPEQVKGQQLFTRSCVGCHLIDGVNQPNKLQIGPNLTHFGSRQLIAGWVVDNNTENLKAWIHDAQAVKPGSDMPAFTNLSDSDVDALVAYLQSLK
ncbi:MAG TPA: cytochrome c oxidase subunit II [Ktedonobacterales bacterium]|nr:cytochrome c oxidase subunit II [Ktedonobacterales bacterium]